MEHYGSRAYKRLKSVDSSSHSSSDYGGWGEACRDWVGMANEPTRRTMYTFPAVGSWT
jgi:hypothetical protein